MSDPVKPGDIVCCSKCGKEIAKVVKKIWIGSPVSLEDIQFFPDIQFKLGDRSKCPECENLWYYATRLFIKGRGWCP